jgi:hypothetical protein
MAKTSTTELPSGSGSGHAPHFCPTCGTFLWHVYRIGPADIIVLATATLDNPHSHPPETHIFIQSKAPWLQLPEQLPHVKQCYEPEIFWSFD